MNIGIVTTWFERGAAYVSRLYEHELSKEHNVFIYARGGEQYAKGDPVWDKGNVYWGKKSYLKWPTAIDFKDFRKWVLKNQISIVFFNEQHWWPILLLCNKLKIITGAYIDYYTEETVPLFANYDFLISNTQRHYSVFKWHPQSYYIPWGTDINLFKPYNFNIVNQEVITFFHSAGKNPYRKGTDFVIKAIEEIDNSKLIIHTELNLSSVFPDLKNKVNHLIKIGKLEVIEETVPAPGLYYLGDVYVYPSRLEGIGLTVPEALASGLPVITSNSPPMNEFVIEGVNGKLIEIEKYVSRKDGYYWPQNIISLDSLVKNMRWFVYNREKLVYYKIEARKYAEKKINWGKNADNINEIFNNVVKQNIEYYKEHEEKIQIFENHRPFKKFYQILKPYHYLQNLKSKIIK